MRLTILILCVAGCGSEQHNCYIPAQKTAENAIDYDCLDRLRDEYFVCYDDCMEWSSRKHLLCNSICGGDYNADECKMSENIAHDLAATKDDE